jgi:hypothetical protein
MALTTLDDLKTYMGIALSNTALDAILTMFKDSVEEAVINYCETDFTLQTVTNEVIDAVRSDIIVIKKCPVRSIIQLILNCDMDGQNGLVIDPTEYNFDSNSVSLRNFHTGFSRGYIRVDYTWGYSAVPAGVKMAVYQSVKAEYQRYKQNSEGVASRSKGDESESFGGGGSGSAWDPYTGLPKQIVSKLQAYKVYEFPLLPMAQRNL